MGRYVCVEQPQDCNFAYCFLNLVQLRLGLLFIMKHGDYVWLTYKQVYDLVIKVGNAIRSCGVEQVSDYSLCVGS